MQTVSSSIVFLLFRPTLNSATTFSSKSRIGNVDEDERDQRKVKAGDESYISFCRLISRMLQRQPEKRASLDDIVKDPWLGGAGDEEGNALATDDQLPLVSRSHLTDEEHAYILKKMVGGGVADREEILEALDLNEYNHVTATYFLLAERLLGAKRHDLALQIRQRPGPVVDMTAGEMSPERSAVSPPPQPARPSALEGLAEVSEEGEEEEEWEALSPSKSAASRANVRKLLP